MKRKKYLSKLLAVGLLGGALALFGCSSGDDGAPGPRGEQGPPGPGAVDLARGVDSPLASTCYSCHQNDGVGSLSIAVTRAHMDNMGAEMFGGSAHGLEPKEGCAACHSGFRTGDGLTENITINFEHQANRAPSIFGSSVDDVTINEQGHLTVNFTINSARYDDAPERVNAEFTIAKWVEEKGSWINLLQRKVRVGEGTIADPYGPYVIRASNLRVDSRETAERLLGIASSGTINNLPREVAKRTYTYTYRSDGDNRYGHATAGTPLVFTNETTPLWRQVGDDDPATYCGDNAACQTFVGGIIAAIETDATWGNGTYRVGVTGRERLADYVRFAAVGDFTVVNGAVATVGVAAPTSQIAQASCTSCHGDRLSFPRNNVHGQQRPNVAVCFTCHNDYTYDADSSVAAADGWVNISMETMIHKIHSGIAGYTVDGYAYENVVYPDWTLAGTSNCTSCHVGDTPAAGVSWNYVTPTNFVTSDVATSPCASCHTAGGYLFDLATHAGGNTLQLPAMSPAACGDCHGATADAIHGVSDRLEALRAQREDFTFNLVSVNDAVYGATPVVRWQVLDAAGNPIALTDAMIHAGPRLHIGWGVGDDWTNEGSGEKSTFGGRNETDGGRPVALNVATTGANANTVISGTTAITTFPAFTNAAAGKGKTYADLEQAEEGRRGFVALHRSINDNGATRLLTSLVQPIVLGAGEAELAAQRRNTVNATTEYGRGGSCLSCHGTIAAHGDGYTADNNVQACIVCHNAGSHKATALVDPTYSVDMMFLMHKTHSSKDILYPQDMPGRCHACHTGSDNDAKGNPINVNTVGTDTNCNLCHAGELNPGRLGVISDWPGSFENYGLRGDGTN